MTVTLLYPGRPPALTAAVASGNDLWLTTDALAATTGWRLETQGFCRGDRCVPVPNGREHELVRDAGGSRGREANVAGLARLLEQAVIRDDAHAVWCVAEAASARRAAMQSLEAPGFTLPDLQGRAHALSDYRGRKVFLVSWASW